MKQKRGFHILAIVWKQLKDTIKNKGILIQFIMFPIMTVIMENGISMEGMPEHFFADMFSVMYVGMAPLTSAAAIIAEEKEKNTLRVLAMSDVCAFEYLFGNAVYILTICMMGSAVIGFAGGYTGILLVRFMLISLLGHIISFLLGAAVGAVSKNQMKATSFTVPIMMIFSFLPMLSMFNDTIGRFAKYIFSQQLFMFISSPEQINVTMESGMILAGNILAVLVLFFRAYKKVFILE